MNLFEVARELSERLIRIFLRDEHGRRPVFGGIEKFQSDPQLEGLPVVSRVLSWRQWRRFGASHQTGWTGLVGSLVELFGQIDGDEFLKKGRKYVYSRGKACPEPDLEPALAHGD